MNRTGRTWLAAAFCAGFLAVGIPYWATPYSKLNLPDAVLGLQLLVVGFSALVASAARAARLRRIVAVMAASVPAAVILRAIVDVLRDPTSHNLWPFELVIALAIGVMAALPGALLGVLATRLVSADGEGDRR
jgi:hypothetical protein